MKNEYRKDYLLDRWVIITANRGKRPKEFVRKEVGKHDEGTCVFCAGNEQLTPPEISRIGDGKGGWLVRCFPNKYNAVDLKFPKAYGTHEVIVETPEHWRRLPELSVEQLEKVLRMYVERTRDLGKVRKIRHVTIFKNEGANAGASIAHTHTQLISMDRLPTAIAEKAEAVRARSGRKGGSVHDRIWKGEKREKERVVYENDHFIAFCPYAPRFAFETWLYAKVPKSRLVDLSEEERSSLAEALRDVLGRMDRLLGQPDYNYYLQSAPSRDRHFRFHVEIAPRLNVWAGFEFGSGIYLNSMPPERAAEALRKA